MIRYRTGTRMKKVFSLSTCHPSIHPAWCVCWFTLATLMGAVGGCWLAGCTDGLLVPPVAATVATMT